MFRTESFHKKNETEYLNDALIRMAHDAEICRAADALMEGAASVEPLFSESLETPQDIRYHAEGPFMRAHLRLMLQTVEAVVKEKMHLIDIEEFRRMKGYEGEIEELEELIKENASFFQVFCMVHDLAKWACVTFSAPHSSLGEKLGFNQTLTYEFDVDHARRVEFRKKYLELFHEFANTHPEESPREIQERFYEAYHIDVHYPHHDRLIHTPLYHQAFVRFCTAHSLTSRDRDMLEDIVSHHVLIGADFSEVRPARIRRYVHLAQKRGYDADDFIDIIQVCLFLDMTAGSMRKKGTQFVHDPSAVIHCLRSEHEYAPQRRREKELQHEEERARDRKRCFREAGLDGVSLLELLQMEPGPQFGRTLKKIHEAIIGEGPMPRVPFEVKQELEKRTSQFYQHYFKQGI